MVRVAGLRKSFGTFRAVDGVGFEVEAGQIFTLLGPSGCGKTTTLRIIAGLETADEAEISIDERVIVSTRRGIFIGPERRELGMVFQSYAIWPHMTVFQNVAYPLVIRKLPKREIRERVMAVLELVGLTAFADRPAPLLSGGQQQRVALCRALVYEPKVLLLDEPFSNLDARLRDQMRGELKRIQRRLAITVVFVTHDQGEALSLSDVIAVMNAGKIEQVGPPSALYDRPETAVVRDFLGKSVVLHGVVASVNDDDSVQVTLPGRAGTVRCSVSRPEEAAVGRPIEVSVRPESLIIDRASGVLSDGGLAGIVETGLFLGDRHEYLVRLENGEIHSIQAPRTLHFADGDAVVVRLPAGILRAWPK